MPHLRIGLTGGVGMGKSSVAAVFAELGAQIVSGDELGRIALEGTPELLAAVRARFGGDIFSPDGRLLRRELGKKVFASAEHVRWLTQLTFPRIHQLWLEAAERSVSDVVVLDAAMIVEWGIESEFDHLVVVTAPEDAVRERLSKGKRLTSQEAIERQRVQVDPGMKAKLADRVIVNSGTLGDLRRQAESFWQDVIAPKLERRRRQRNVAED